MTFKKFLILSLVLHFLIIVGVSRIPAPQEKKIKEIITSLLTPEEAGIEDHPLSDDITQRAPARTAPPAKKIIPRIPPASAPHSFRPPGEIQKEPHGTEDKASKPGILPDKGIREGPSPEITPGDKRIGTGQSEAPTGTAPAPKLFDPDVISDIARLDSGREKSRDSSVTFDSRDYQFAPYMKKLKEKIESIWIYPPEEARRGIFGDLKIRFTILKNGRLGAVDLIRTSGYKSLDDAAIRALRAGEPYWPLPDDWGMNSYTIMGHFIYSSRGYYIR